MRQSRRFIGCLILAAGMMAAAPIDSPATAETVVTGNALAYLDYRPTDELVRFRPAVTRPLYERSLLRRSSINC